MMELLLLSLAIFLRLFGLFWMIGGVLTFQKARESQFMDTVLEAITQQPEDRLVSHFLVIGSVLTFLTGLGLLLASRWGLIPLGALVISQGIYFILKNHRFQQAQSEEERESYRIQPSTRNAFVFSLVIFALALGAERLAILR